MKTKFIFFISLALFTAFLSGCRGWGLVGFDGSKTDSVMIVRTEYRERIDTAFVTIERWIQQVMVDTVSTLENDYCISKAEVNKNGFLYHSLETKPSRIPVAVTNTETVRDSIIFKDKVIKVPEPYKVEVERDLTGWQLFRLHGFWYLLAALMLALIWICRKPLLKIILRVARGGL